MAVLRSWLCVVMLVSLPLMAADAPLRLRHEVPVSGRPVEFDAELQLRPAAGGATAVEARVDLAPLLPALRTALLDRLPRDPCRRHGLENWVAELRRSSLRVDDDWLVLEIELDVAVWACLEVHRSELRRPLSRGQVRLLLPMRVAAEGAGLRLRIGRPQVSARGPLADAARVWSALRGEDLGEALARRARAIDARRLVLPPPALWLHQGQLVSARFIDTGRPSLELIAEWRPQLPGWIDRLWPGG